MLNFKYEILEKFTICYVEERNQNRHEKIWMPRWYICL